LSHATSSSSNVRAVRRPDHQKVTSNEVILMNARERDSKRQRTALNQEFDYVFALTAGEKPTKVLET